MSAFSDAGHLPKLRPEGDRFDPYRLPRQRRGISPQMHGRYPDFNVVEQAPSWDEPTRRVVIGRVDRVPARRFFAEDEWITLSVFADVVTAQDREPRIPVLAFVDERLFTGRGEGYRHVEMPPDGEVWRLVARALDDGARADAGAPFATAGDECRLRVVERFAGGELESSAWRRCDQARAWKLVTRDIVSAFYAHPWAWNEIGFGGPAYPRGYMRLGVGESEPWEGLEAGEVTRG